MELRETQVDGVRGSRGDDGGWELMEEDGGREPKVGWVNGKAWGGREVQ